MKRTRLVDVLLMVGLFLVGAAILWTLFTLGNDRARPADADEAPPGVEAPADPDASGDVEVVPPRGSGGAEPVAADPAANGNANENQGEEQDDGADAAEGASGASDGEDAADAGAGAGGEPADAGAQDAPADDAPADDAEDADAADPSPPPAPAEPIAEGEPVALSRVGFSFATGGAGACGIELEPWEHVAVSRDVLAVYGCGTEVVIELGDEIAGRTQATLVVADTMNEQFSRTANVYVDPEEPALEYGITDGTLIP